jgi:Glutamate-cysteine ligase family 2(GCS2)
MLLEPGDWSLAQSSDDVIRRLSDELSPHASPETHAAVIELATGIHPDVDGVVAELTWLRRRLAGELGGMGLSVAAAGTYPLTVREETEVSGAVRYRALNDSMRVLARREPTMALHVHVGVPAPEDAIRLLNGLRRNIPGAACALGQLSVLAGTRVGLRVRAHRDLPGLSPLGPATILRRLRGLRRDGRCADRLGGDTRSELPMVGRTAAAGTRDCRGTGDGCTISGPGRPAWSR